MDGVKRLTSILDNLDSILFSEKLLSECQVPNQQHFWSCGSAYCPIKHNRIENATGHQRILCIIQKILKELSHFRK